MRRKRLFGGFLLLFLMGMSAGPVVSQEKIPFFQDWLIQGRTAPWYVAIEKGLYGRERLEVAIERGYGSSDTIKKVAAGVAPIGMADFGALVIGRAQGTKVKELGIITDRPMHAVWTLEGSGIRTPKDLEGKTMASPVGDVHRTLFPAFAAAAGFDEKKVKWIDVDGAALTQTLVAGRADAIPYFLIVGPNVRAAAKAAGKNLHVLKWSDYGIEIYSSGVIVTDDTVAQKADLLRRFMRASWEGLAWSIEHPKEAIDLLLKHNPTMNEAFARENWEITMDHLLTEDAAKNGVGYMTPEKVTKTRDLMTKYAKLAVTAPVEDLYTNAFLPRLFPKRAKE